MNTVFQELIKRKKYLQQLLNEVENKLSSFPEGTLRVSKINGMPRYYQVTRKGDTQGKYIKKKNVDLARQLAQKDYMKKMYQRIRKELDDIERSLNLHKSEELEVIYAELNQYRKELVSPLVVSDEIIAK